VTGTTASTPAGGTPLARKLAAFLSLSATELLRLDQLQSRRRVFPAGAELVHEEQAEPKAFVLLDGWAMSYKMLVDGGRQVVDFQIAGDFLGLRGLLLRTSDHNVAAVTEIVVAEVPARDVRELVETQPRLAMSLLWAASRDEAMVVEHLVGIGRRSPLVRTAHLFLELRHRLHLVGLADDGGFTCPLNQYVLADALGLTAIHLNRTLRQLRERRLMTYRRGRVIIHDAAALMALAGFEDAYLDQGGPS
jgi:CRP-like cAMP-binding protein